MLRDWFESNRAKYDEPARYDFEEAVLAGDSSEAAVRSFVTALNAGTPGDAQGRPARVQGPAARQPRAELRRRSSPRRSTQSPAGEWHALRTRDGLARHAARTRSRRPKPAVFEALRGVVLQDWTDATMAEQRSAAVRALAKKYTVKIEADDAE